VTETGSASPDRAVPDDRHPIGDLARECARHWLPRSGFLRKLRQLDRLLTTAMIADLLLCGRISDGDSLSVDTSATHDAATDVLLTFVQNNPAHSLASLLEHGPSLHEVVVDRLIELGVWEAKGAGRFHETQLASMALPDRDDVPRIVLRGHPADEFDTGLAILLYPWTGMHDLIFTRCGAASAFLKDYVSKFGVGKLGTMDLLGALGSGWSG
jgi:hypothetical protein